MFQIALSLQKLSLRYEIYLDTQSLFAITSTKQILQDMIIIPSLPYNKEKGL